MYKSPYIVNILSCYTQFQVIDTVLKVLSTSNSHERHWILERILTGYIVAKSRYSGANFNLLSAVLYKSDSGILLICVVPFVSDMIVDCVDSDCKVTSSFSMEFFLGDSSSLYLSTTLCLLVGHDLNALPCVSNMNKYNTISFPWKHI